MYEYVCVFSHAFMHCRAETHPRRTVLRYEPPRYNLGESKYADVPVNRHCGPDLKGLGDPEWPVDTPEKWETGQRATENLSDNRHDPDEKAGKCIILPDPHAVRDGESDGACEEEPKKPRREVASVVLPREAASRHSREDNASAVGAQDGDRAQLLGKDDETDQNAAHAKHPEPPDSPSLCVSGRIRELPGEGGVEPTLARGIQWGTAFQDRIVTLERRDWPSS